MEEIKIFENDEFGKIRTLNIDGEPWFVGKDICEAFGDTNYRRSLSVVDKMDKGVSQIKTLGGTKNFIKTLITPKGQVWLTNKLQEYVDDFFNDSKE